jgi:hypothetical protein
MFWKLGVVSTILSRLGQGAISGALMIPITEMKLREAQFFWALLHKTGQQIIRNEPEAFAFYLNAFLSAARAVTFALQWEDKTSYDRWFPPWCGTRTETDRELLRFMVIQRNFAEKRGSPEFTADDRVLTERRGIHAQSVLVIYDLDMCNVRSYTSHHDTALSP